MAIAKGSPSKQDAAGKHRVHSKTADRATGAPKTADKTKTREQVYRQHFTSPAIFVGPEEFIQQVNGYGSPIFSAVGTTAGT